ncbi:MAG: glycosyltransferase [Methylococcales bacterium]|nr:glycosyltransferase [Methylococcales bacterium]
MTAQVSLIVPVGPGDGAFAGVLADSDGAEDVLLERLLVGCQPVPDNLALPSDVRWLQGAQGRAVQLNHGASAALGEWLWFVHADSRFSTRALLELERFCQNGPGRLGYFGLRFAEDGPNLMWLNAWAANLRSRWPGLPFGDQGLLLHRDDFRRVGGFRADFGRGEDLEWVVRGKALGLRLTELDAAIITSARRYQQHGWLPTTAKHIGLTLWQTLKACANR